MLNDTLLNKTIPEMNEGYIGQCFNLRLKSFYPTFLGFTVSNALWASKFTALLTCTRIWNDGGWMRQLMMISCTIVVPLLTNTRTNKHINAMHPLNFYLDKKFITIKSNTLKHTRTGTQRTRWRTLMFILLADYITMADLTKYFNCKQY